MQNVARPRRDRQAWGTHDAQSFTVSFDAEAIHLLYSMEQK
jgi:hypothetical protein